MSNPTVPGGHRTDERSGRAREVVQTAPLLFRWEGLGDGVIARAGSSSRSSSLSSEHVTGWDGDKMDTTPWKWEILRQLRLRNDRERGGFSELISSRKCVPADCART